MYAHAVFGVAHTLFGWAVNRGTYQIEHSPCYGIKVGDLLSRRKQPRQRVLSDDEVLAFWKATGRLGYPWQQLFRLILVTGTRRSEATGARWTEINERDALWSIPPERFKSNTTHLVALSDTALELLATVPRFNSGDHLFSCNFGKTPAVTLHKVKLRLDALMLRYLRALARLRGNVPATVLKPYQTHDLRRVARSKLAALGIAEHVAEQCLGHGKRNLLQRTYNTYRYVPEVRLAMQAWADELKRIVTVPRRQRGVR
jgi:integrase